MALSQSHFQHLIVVMAQGEEGGGKKKKIGRALRLVDESPPNIKQQRGVRLRVRSQSLSSPLQRHVRGKRLVKASLGPRFSPPPPWCTGAGSDGCGTALHLPPLSSAAEQMSQREERGKKNRSNYSSNYLIISLCGGEQEGGWRRSLCFLSPSALPSWWRHLRALSSQRLPFCSACADFTATCILLFIYPLTSNTNRRSSPVWRRGGGKGERRRRCRRLKVLTRNKLKTIRRERWESLCFRANEWGHRGGWWWWWWGSEEIAVIRDILKNKSGNWCILLFSAKWKTTGVWWSG